jgi:hypothetical protein
VAFYDGLEYAGDQAAQRAAFVRSFRANRSNNEAPVV